MYVSRIPHAKLGHANRTQCRDYLYPRLRYNSCVLLNTPTQAPHDDPTNTRPQDPSVSQVDVSPSSPLPPYRDPRAARPVVLLRTVTTFGIRVLGVIRSGASYTCQYLHTNYTTQLAGEAHFRPMSSNTKLHHKRNEICVVS